MGILTGKKYISSRSPHNNQYYPSIDDGKLPAEPLRQLEIKLNQMFHLYVLQYYSQGALSSVYLYEVGSNIKDGFIVAVLIKSSIEAEKQLSNGVWDSINFIYVTFNKGKGSTLSVTYKLTTTIILKMVLQHKNFTELSLSGSLTRQVVLINQEN